MCGGLHSAPLSLGSTRKSLHPARLSNLDLYFSHHIRQPLTPMYVYPSYTSSSHMFIGIGSARAIDCYAQKKKTRKPFGTEASTLRTIHHPLRPVQRSAKTQKLNTLSPVHHVHNPQSRLRISVKNWRNTAVRGLDRRRLSHPRPQITIKMSQSQRDDLQGSMMMGCRVETLGAVVIPIPVTRPSLSAATQIVHLSSPRSRRPSVVRLLCSDPAVVVPSTFVVRQNFSRIRVGPRMTGHQRPRCLDQTLSSIASPTLCPCLACHQHHPCAIG